MLTNQPTAYDLISTKGRRTMTGTLAQAIEAAKAMDAELQPMNGVTVERVHDRVTVAEVDNGRAEIVEDF